MENDKKTPDEDTPTHGVSPEAGDHTEHGIPPAVHDAEATGLPNSDRAQTETVATKP
jgi:hypothetical protein